MQRFISAYVIFKFIYAKCFLEVLKNIPWVFRSLNPQAPVVQKVADEVVFRRFQGEEDEFF